MAQKNKKEEKMFKKVVLKFPRITVTISEHFVTIYPTSNEPYSKPYTPQELQQWINGKSILKEYPINSKAIKQLETLLTQIQKSTVKKPQKKNTLADNHNTDEQECIDFADKTVDKIENGPPSVGMKTDQRFLKSLPPPEPLENVLIQTPNIAKAESEKTTVLPLKGAVVKQSNFMTIKKRHHDIINAVIVSHKKTVSHSETKMIIPSFKIALHYDKEEDINYVWLNSAQKLTAKEFIQLLKDMFHYINEKPSTEYPFKKPSIETFYYNLYDDKFFVPGSLPVPANIELFNILKEFYNANKKILLPKKRLIAVGD